MIRLVLPSKKYIKGNSRAIAELYKRKTISKKELDEKLEKRKNVSAFIKSLKDARSGIGIKKDQVPYTIYWLVNGKKFIGTLRLNKKLNRKLRVRGGNIGYEIRPSERRKGYGGEVLRLGLLKARAHGLEKVYIDCREDNIGSKKIIEKRGGVFIKKRKGKKNEPASLHYCFRLR